MIIFEILPALLFILSSGLIFNERFRSNRTLVLTAGCVALVASYFLAEQIIDRMISSRIDGRFSPTQQPIVQRPTTGAPLPTAETRQAAITTQEIDEVFRRYIAAWQSGDVGLQASLLDIGFSYIDQEGVRQGREAYLRQKQELAAKYRASSFSANIKVGVANVSFETRGEIGSVMYDQTYESPFYSSFGRNRFVMRKHGTTVKIVEEIFSRQTYVRRDPNQPSGT